MHSFAFINAFVCLFGFLTSSSTTRLYRGPVIKATHWFYIDDFCVSWFVNINVDPEIKIKMDTGDITHDISVYSPTSTYLSTCIS